MSVDLEKSDRAAASWYRWHGIFSQPNYRVIEYFKRYGNPVDPTVFDNCSTKVREYAYRAFGPAAAACAAAFLAKYATRPQIGLLVIGFLAFQIGRIALHILGFATQKKNYIHVRGKAPEIDIVKPKIMSWNILGFPAGMNYTCGGCIPFRDRFPGIVETIRREKPDILVLQECVMDSSVTEAFINEFIRDYANFYIHNGPNMWGLESGLLVMTKSKVSKYTFTPFANNARTFSRGFATLTIPAIPGGRSAFAVIGTHMEAGSNRLKRWTQLKQIQAHANTLSDVESVILAGDTNMLASEQHQNCQHAPRREDRQFLDNALYDVYSEADGQETCTTELNNIRYPSEDSALEWIDQVSLIKKDKDRDKAPVLVLTKPKVIPAYQRVDGKIDSKKALSDHNALIATLNNA